MTTNAALAEIAPLLIGVQTNPERDITLASLAREHGLSPAHFHRVFKKALGETPKDHVERVRLERAAYRLALTEESVLDIALSVGFRSHETFTRAFKRRFGRTPSEWRQSGRESTKRVRAGKTAKGQGCTVSEVAFLTLKPMTLLALRRLGPYGTMGPPDYDGGPSDWKPLFDIAAKRKLAWRRPGLVICYDNPYLTPPELQSLDACVPLLKPEGAPRTGAVRRLDFKGGLYGAVEFRGPVDKLIQGYHALVDGILRSPRFRVIDGPPVEILREVSPDGDPMKNLNEIYLPVEPKR
jgi:AraC family transcriptional regulator